MNGGRVWRVVLAVILAALANVLVVSGLEWLVARAYPVPLGAGGMPDLARVPAEAKALVVAGWTLGAFAAGWVAAAVARHRRWAWTGAALTLFGVVTNAALFPHPPWMLLAGVLLPVVAVWLAGRLAPTGTPIA